MVVGCSREEGEERKMKREREIVKKKQKKNFLIKWLKKKVCDVECVVK